ncbi:MAG: hypothetical protein ACKVIL_02710 [Pseudomonadales bacterium]|jgi:hypothetical protein|tara:strand:- start:4750 stop:5913 length:1164 start_codon:yes stop_codon:yes gene_type:complete
MKLSNPLQRISRLSCATLLGLVIASSSLAQEDPDSPLLVSGQALVTNGDVETAVIRAVLDALRTAATQREGQVTSHSIVNEQGQLTENISLKTNLNILRMDIVEQDAVQGIATVKLALELDENEKDCQPPQLTQVVTTDLAPPPGNNNYHQIDINQLLLDTETQFSNLVKSVNFVTHRINPALNTYQTAWLASEAYNQADYHLAIGAQWLPTSDSKPSTNSLSKLISSFSSQTIQSPTLMLSATFSSPYLPHIDLHHQQQFTLPANQSIAASSESIPQELSEQVAKWVQNSWNSIYQTVQCEGSYIKLSKIIDQPLWRINKGQKLGLEQGQQLLLLPQNYQNGILNPDAASAPQVFKVTLLQPHAALLEHIAGPDNITATTAQVIVF